MARDLHEQRPRKSTQRYVDQSTNIAYALAAAQEIDDCDEPKSYFEATSDGDSSQWVATVQEEIENFNKNETWDLVKLPDG